MGEPNKSVCFSSSRLCSPLGGRGSANAAALPPLDLFPQMEANIVVEENANAGHKGGSISLMIVFTGQLVNIKMMVEATAASNCGAGRPAACWMRINFNRTQSTPFPSILSTPFFLFSHPLPPCFHYFCLFPFF